MDDEEVRRLLERVNKATDTVKIFMEHKSQMSKIGGGNK